MDLSLLIKLEEELIELSQVKEIDYSMDGSGELGSSIERTYSRLTFRLLKKYINLGLSIPEIRMYFYNR